MEDAEMQVAPRKFSLDEVMPLVYDELHRLAATYMRRERDDHTLQPTALINETYLRLVGQHSVDFSNRSHLLGTAAQMMRRILSTHQEGRSAEKRGSNFTILCLSETHDPVDANALVFSEVDDALNRLQKLDKRQALVAELRIFGGLTAEESAEYLGVSPITVHRDWVSARLWLARELRATASGKACTKL